jgi:membrane protein YqaA with SNARE-associated domain
MAIDGLMWLGLFAVFVISFLGSGPIPLPLTATILWLGQFHFPILIVFIATAGTLLGWICLQGILKQWISSQPQLAQKIPIAYQKFFLRRTGLWLFIFNALPLPLDFIRFLALLNNYNPTRLLVILTVSRLIRNTMLVAIGAALARHQLLLWSVMIGFLVVPLLIEQVMKRTLHKTT